MAEKRTVPRDYFILTYPGITIFLVMGLSFMLIAWLWPEWPSPTYMLSLAPFLTWLGTEHNSLVKWCFIPVMTIHMIETIVAFYYCIKLKLSPLTTAKWTLQVFVVGIISLKHLMWPLTENIPSRKNSKIN